LINFNFELGSIATKAIPKSLTFQESYAKKYGETVREKLSGHGAGPAYENVYILADAIKRTGSLDGDALASAIEKTDMEGIIGKMKFNEDHQLIYNNNPAEGVVSVAFQWVAPGTRVIVYPDNLAERQIELPSYMKK
jgi:branched-chain amino acid transport system substrate-binding protein